MLKVGGHVFPKNEKDARDPEKLARLAGEMGYSAVYAPEYLTIDKPEEIREAKMAFQ